MSHVESCSRRAERVVRWRTELELCRTDGSSEHARSRMQLDGWETAGGRWM